MKLARGVERRLERMVDGLAAKLFRGSLQPVEIGNRLVREADLAVVETSAGPSIPNVYRIRMSAADLDAQAVPLLQTELASVVAETAAERGWRLEGPINIAVDLDPTGGPGSLAVETGFATGAMAPWAHLIEIEGTRTLPVSHGRSLVGRSRECDLCIDDLEISRFHALIWREAGQEWVADLESANGTRLNGIALTNGSSLHDGDVLAFGPAAFTFQRR